MGDLTNNFSRYEFECRCGCKFDDVDLVFVERLQRIRDRSGVRMTVNSGCRCEHHNSHEGGSTNSDHLTGEGADIKATNSRIRHKIINAAMKENMPRIGIGKTFVHLGMNADNDSEVLWLY